ncbi:unnamed protein product [Amoebophrya sp. A25]|nr:unnamed protein product [Amoebophrya sp. A25]|eukprot:GSA25T00027419001.1
MKEDMDVEGAPRPPPSEQVEKNAPPSQLPAEDQVPPPVITTPPLADNAAELAPPGQDPKLATPVYHLFQLKVPGKPRADAGKTWFEQALNEDRAFPVSIPEEIKEAPKRIQTEDELHEFQPQNVKLEWRRVHWCEQMYEQQECEKYQQKVEEAKRAIDVEGNIPSPNNLGAWLGRIAGKLASAGEDLKSLAPRVQQCTPLEICKSGRVKDLIPLPEPPEKPEMYFFEEDFQPPAPGEADVASDPGVPVRGRVDWNKHEVIAAIGKTPLPDIPEPTDKDVPPYEVVKEPGHFIIRETPVEKIEAVKELQNEFDWGKEFRDWWVVAPSNGSKEVGKAQS